jgi:hypothetical protein
MVSFGRRVNGRREERGELSTGKERIGSKVSCCLDSDEEAVVRTEGEADGLQDFLWRGQ